jgi:hypothetical protein
MNRLTPYSTLVLLSLLGLATCAHAQQEPRIGYVYPAGGQQGTTFEVTLGGQYLDGVDAVITSGEGIEANVVEHDKPLTQRQVNDLREKLQEAQKGMPMAMRGRYRRGDRPDLSEFADQVGISEKDLLKMRKQREERSDPKVQPNPQISEMVTLEVTVVEDSPTGPRELRLMTSRGLSNPIRFHVGQLSEFLENEPNDKSADSTIDELPVVLNGQILPGDVDRFDFQAHRGQQLVVSASARELIPYLADAVPGWFQATLALYDSDGEEVAYVDDFQFHPDPTLFFEIPGDGTYTLEIKDSVYRGREDFVYRIALGELPFVTSVFPLGGPKGENATVEMTGWNLPEQSVTVNKWSAASGEIHLDSAQHTGGTIPFAVDTIPECLEQEPNNRREDATQLDFPMIVNGRIDESGDWDLFQFEGREGKTIVAEVVARRLSSPLDSVIELTDADGKQLAFNDDYEDKAVGMTTHHADSRLSITLPADGLYTLRLGDRQQGGGPSHAYRLRISYERPDFELRVVPASVNLRAGGTASLTVYAVRRDGFNGHIAISLKNGPRGMTLSGGWIPAGQDLVRLTVSAPPFARESVVSLDVEGTATIDGQEVRRSAVPAEDMMQAFIYQHLVPAEELLASIRPNPRGGGTVRILEQDPVQIPVGGTTIVRLTAPASSMTAQLKFELSEPPDGIAIDRVTFGEGPALLVLSADADMAEPGNKGNLIVDVFIERSLSRDGVAQPVRRIPVGVLPAIPFEVVEPRTWLDEAISAAER